MKEANFSESNFKGALFDKTNLEKANFTQAQNTSIDVRSNMIEGAMFNADEALFLLEGIGITLVE